MEFASIVSPAYPQGMINSSKFDSFLQQLHASPFFSGSDASTLTALAREAKQIHLDAGEVIFLEGEPSKGLFWLEEGTVKAVKYSPEGKEQILHFIKVGETFNEVGAFTTLPNPATVVALEAATVWCIPREAIAQRIQADPAFAQMIIDTLSLRLRHSVNLIEDLSLRSVLSRLSRLILEGARDGTLQRPAWYTQQELAARLGTVTDVVRRALRNLENDDVIAVDRRQIRILDEEALKRRAAYDAS